LRNEQGIQVHKPKSYKAQFQNIQQTGRKATFALLMPIIILGTIYSGLATPTEAASIAVVYSVVIGLMVYKGISIKQLMDITVSSVAMTGSIIAVLFFLFVMSRAMVFQQIPNQIADALLQISDNKLVLLLLINVLLMLIGMIVDDISGSILAAVIFLPIIKALGIDPIHFAAIVGVNLGLGNISPPCAPMLFMAGGVAKLSLDKYIKPTMKLILFGHLPMVLIVTFIPSLSLYLPSVLL
jgi:tripartite ATP-independent transporter DctM subunit